MPPLVAFCLGLLAGACLTLLVLCWLACLLEPARFEMPVDDDVKA